MAVEIKVPALGESVTEATVAKWLMKAGDAVAVDQPLCELETDKVTVEVPATGGRHDRSISPSRKAPRSRWAACSCHIEAGAAARPRPACRRPRRPRPSPQRRRRRARHPSPAAAPVSRRLRPTANIAASGPAVRKLAEETGVAPRPSSRPARTAAPPRPT